MYKFKVWDNQQGGETVDNAVVVETFFSHEDAAQEYVAANFGEGYFEHNAEDGVMIEVLSDQGVQKTINVSWEYEPRFFSSEAS